MSNIVKLNSNTVDALRGASTKAVEVFHSTQGGAIDIAAALTVAESIHELRELFSDPSIKDRITKLQDTALGFRTDRDPRIKNRKTNEYNTPYSYEVVKDCAIEATLRGLQIVGNHWNIISGRTYVTKEGFEFLIRKVKGLAKFNPTIGVPKSLNGGALVECSAKWVLNNEEDACAATIPVKGDDYSNADQYIGKATRKFLKRCYEQMTGVSVPDGEEESEAPQIAEPKRAKLLASELPPVPVGTEPKHDKNAPPVTTTAPPPPPPPPTPKPVKLEVIDGNPDVLTGPWAELADIVKSANARFENLAYVLNDTSIWKEMIVGVGGIGEIKKEHAERLVAKRKTLSAMLGTAVNENLTYQP